MLGQILGDRYEIEEQLGKKLGQWTLLARDLQTQTPVILKLIAFDAELLSSDVSLFQREAEVLKTLNHPDTPRYLDYFEIEFPKEGKFFVLVQTFLDGTSLQQYLEQGIRLTETEARDVGKAVLKILRDLHQRQPPIIHRNIKPGNILLASPLETITDRVSLIDFGSIKSLIPYDETTASLSETDGYTPPEQMGRRAVPASDLYSLGVTLLMAMTGTSPVELPRQGLQIDIAQVLRCQPELMQWLQQITDPDLDHRFVSADAALNALQQIV